MSKLPLNSIKQPHRLTKDELIAKQQIELEYCKSLLETNFLTKEKLISKLFSIGAPLNGNRLLFNKEQQDWAFQVEELILSIHSLSIYPKITFEEE